MGKGSFGNLQGALNNVISSITNKGGEGVVGSNNMIQNLGGNGGGLAESGSNTYTQPTLMSGITNPVADSSVFGNRTNGSGMVNGHITQGYNGGLAAMANGYIKAPGQYDVVGGAKLI